MATYVDRAAVSGAADTTLAGTPAGAARPASLWQRLWRRPVVRRAFYELVGLFFIRRPGLQMLNCGHHEENYPHFPLSALAEEERVSYQLYHRLSRSVPDWHGKDVVEFGCGRGGGARFLAETLAPRRYLATDASRLLIFAGRRLGAPTNMKLAVARADAVPEPNGSFDIGLAVETVSALADRSAFLDEASRVLRPRGTLLITDFFYTRANARNAAESFRALVAASSFRLIREENWTAQAVRALEVDSPRRLGRIKRLPPGLRRVALAFAGTTQSPLYRQLRDGRAQHLHFVLQNTSGLGL